MVATLPGVEDELRIDDLAREAGVATTTVRLYQRRRLLPPPRLEGRTGWYGERLLQRGGHAVHRVTGVRVDADMRPLNAAGEPVLDNLQAVGHLLTGFNPLTDGCAEGVDLVTAYRAVETALGSAS